MEGQAKLGPLSVRLRLVIKPRCEAMSESVED